MDGGVIFREFEVIGCALSSGLTCGFLLVLYMGSRNRYGKKPFL